MNNTIKYSVIIPIYNSENTIARCLESLTARKRADVQIIAVNDGSKDGSGEIVLRFAAENPAIEYIYQENAGVSRARNTGLKHAKGTYVTFVDSDDYVTEDYFDVLDQAEDCDLLVFAHENVGGACRNEGTVFAALQKINKPAQRLELLLASRILMSPINKRFKRVHIENKGLRFVEGMHIGEDFNFCFAYALECRSIEVVSKVLYYADISNSGSLSRKYRPHLDDQMVAVYARAARSAAKSDVYQQHIENLFVELDYLFVKNLFSSIMEELRAGKLHYFKDHGKLVSICRKFVPRYSRKYKNIVHRGLRTVLDCRMYFIFYWVSYWKIRH